FPLTEATLDELVQCTGLPAAELDGILESMANKGLVMDLPYNGQTFYLLVPGLIGFMEFTFMRSRTDLPQAELARLMSEYLREQGKDGQAGEFFGGRWPLTRALVHGDRIPVQTRITPWEDACQIIRDADFHAVTTCFCRHKKVHQGQTCQQGAPMEEICMVLGQGARFLVRRGFAEQRTKTEMLTILEQARNLGLTQITDNIRERPSFLCNCCRCCCELLSGVQMGFDEGVAKTPFLATIDAQRCDYCGACLRACNAKCIGLAEAARALPHEQRWAEVNSTVCLGCGACLPACEHQALSLVPRPGHRNPPRDRNHLFARMLWDKGRLWPYISEGLRRGFGRLRRRP
ncbi:MAG TPA: 4Fe-4S ferredoxin, partial [Chromatiaceae bacterium]|nr:4Fe-4S ferredoxin [Chromatiaceae bacterium]